MAKRAATNVAVVAGSRPPAVRGSSVLAARSTGVGRAAYAGSVGKTVRLGRVGPGGEYAGIHVGAQLGRHKRRTEYYVGVSADRIAVVANKSDPSPDPSHRIPHSAITGRIG